MGKLICTSECEKCENCIIDDTNKSKIYIYCKEKDKRYFYGQYIDCEKNQKYRS